jgi:2-iminobutanoate/2-iminopropanoate deaminase
MELVNSREAPAAVGPYAQATRAGDTVYCSGQVGIDPATGKLVDGGIVAETRQALRNLGHVLAAAGLSLADAAKTTVSSGGWTRSSCSSTGRPQTCARMCAA